MNVIHRPVVFLVRHAALLKSAVTFGVFLIIFYAILNIPWTISHLINPFTTVVATVTVWLFTALGQVAHAQGQSVEVNGTTLSIMTGCNGVEVMALYFAAVLGMPTKWSKRLSGLAIGFVGIFVFNQIRVVGLFLISMYWPDFFEMAHIYAGQTFVIVMGMALWIFWVETYADLQIPQSPASAL